VFLNQEIERICSFRQLLPLPMILGLWTPTRWPGLVCKCLQTDGICEVPCSLIRFLKFYCAWCQRDRKTMQSGPSLPLNQQGSRMERSLQGAQNPLFSWFLCDESLKVLHYFVNTEACLGRRTVSVWPCMQPCKRCNGWVKAGPACNPVNVVTVE